VNNTGNFATADQAMALGKKSDEDLREKVAKKMAQKKTVVNAEVFQVMEPGKKSVEDLGKKVTKRKAQTKLWWMQRQSQKRLQLL